MGTKSPHPRLHPPLVIARRPGLSAPIVVGIASGLLAAAALMVVIRLRPEVLSARALLWTGPLAPLAILLHEAGHALGVWLTGMQLADFAVGPVRARRDGGRLRWGLNRIPAYWAGIMGIVAPEGVPSARLAARFAWILACGPLTNIAVGTVAWSAAGRSFARGGAAPLLQAFALMNLALGLAPLLPFPFGGSSDGARLLRLLRGGATRRAEAARLAVVSALRKGVAPRDWPAAEVAAMTLLPAPGRLGALSHALAYHHAIDSDQIAQAARHLQRWVDLAAGEGPLYWSEPALEAACFEAMYGEGGAAGRAWLGRVSDTRPELYVLRCRAEAAVLAAEGDRAGAAEHLARARRAATEALPPHAAALLDRIAAELEAPANRPAMP